MILALLLHVGLACATCHTSRVDGTMTCLGCHVMGKSHPVGVPYEGKGLRDRSWPVGEGTIESVMLRDGRVECVSCHDAHTAKLVVDDYGSRLCLTCHVK